jgi:hypothetical protein
METALNPERREVWVGLPTVITILANKLAPGVLDRYLARTGYSGQLTDEPVPSDAPAKPLTAIRVRMAASTTVPATGHPDGGTRQTDVFSPRHCFIRVSS